MTTKSSKPSLFDHVSFLESLLPEIDQDLNGRALELIRQTERLGPFLHPLARKSISQLVRSMNSYYSNLIEGHRTTPQDMDAALRKQFSSDTKKHSLQLLHLAHVQVQEEMEARLEGMSAREICSIEFLCWLHEQFYRRLPEDLQHVEDGKGKLHRVVPGELRDGEVSVGRHMAPASKSLPAFMARFGESYGSLVNREPGSVVAAAAAHHRLVWIHPFFDGNGRVARLFSQAWLIKSGMASGGIWTMSRGLARRQEEYRATLANADEKRINDFDGRGYLSQKYLREFCLFFLDTALDQVKFMQELLQLDAMQFRIMGFAGLKEATTALPSGSGLILREIFLRGEIARGEVSRIAGVSPRTAQKITGELLSKHLVSSPSSKGPLRLDFSPEAASYYFPNLYPAGAEEEK